MIYKTEEEFKFLKLQKELNIQPAVKIVSRYDLSMINIHEDVLQINIPSYLPDILKLTNFLPYQTILLEL